MIVVFFTHETEDFVDINLLLKIEVIPQIFLEKLIFRKKINIAKNDNKPAKNPRF